MGASGASYLAFKAVTVEQRWAAQTRVTWSHPRTKGGGYTAQGAWLHLHPAVGRGGQFAGHLSLSNPAPIAVSHLMS